LPLSRWGKKREKERRGKRNEKRYSGKAKETREWGAGRGGTDQSRKEKESNEGQEEHGLLTNRDASLQTNLRQDPLASHLLTNDG